MSADRALVVPINVQALCVGDESIATSSFAAIAADFDNLPGMPANNGAPREGAFVASRVFADPFTEGRLARGVHLHWALPDALARGETDGTGATAFPAVPNRWLVTRIAPVESRTGPAASALCAWVIESDQLWDGDASPSDPPQNADSRTTPVRPGGGEAAADGRPSRKLGRVYRLKDYRPGPDGRMAGCAYAQHLTALGYGIIGFAAAYPHAPNVFGFRDDAADLPSGVQGITYSVIGWYAGGAADPLASPYEPKTDTASRLADLGWALDPALAAGVQTQARTLCAGLMRGVHVVTTGRPIPAAPKDKLDVVIGRTIPEALAALMAGDHLGQGLAGADGDAEHLLLLFQLGLLDPSSHQDRAAEVAEAAHQATFGARSSGCVWKARPADGVTAPPPLDAQLAGDLAALNLDQMAFDALRARFVDRQRQLFADWLQVTQGLYGSAAAPYSPADWNSRQALLITQAAALLFAKPSAALDPIGPALAAQASAWMSYALAPNMGAEPPVPAVPAWIGGALGELIERREKLRAAVGALPATLAPARTLSAAPAPPHQHPAEPVIVLRGPVVSLSTRHGSDGAEQPDGRLPCRAPDRLIQSATTGTVRLDATHFPSLPANPALPPEAGALVLEVMLLDPLARQRAGGTAEAPGVGGAEPPDPLAITNWTQPWLPLCVQWEVAVQRGIDTLDGWTLGADEIELSRPPQPLPAMLPTISGQTFLTGRTQIDLAHMIDRYVSFYPDDAAAKALQGQDGKTTLEATALTLSGFVAKLLMRDQALQLPPADPLAAADDTARQVLARLMPIAVGPQNVLAPAPSETATPVWSGALQIVRLRIVDAFGRFADVIDTQDQATASAVPIVAEALASGRPSTPGLLAKDVYASAPPRLAPPCRLLMRWLAAGDAAVPQLNDAVSVSPVCGWILFNHLDMTLDVFAAAGRPFGALDPAAPTRWTDAPGLAGVTARGRPCDPGGALQGADTQLFAFVRCALANGPGYLAALIEAIDLQMQGINPLGMRQDQGLALLVGAPMALVRACLRLEVSGLAPLDQSAAAFAKVADAYSAQTSQGADPDQLDASWGDFSRRAELGLASVKVPVRLGDLGLLEDGLVGYFRSDPAQPSTVDFSRFFASALAPEHQGAALRIPDPNVAAPPARDLTLSPVSPVTSAPDRVVAMLVDPRGAVHATTGVLPVVEFRLAPDFTSAALRSIAVSFLTAPVLAAADSRALPQAPIPNERGRGWEWLVPTQGPGASAPVESWGKFGPRRSLLTQPSAVQILEGWLRLSQT